MLFKINQLGSTGVVSDIAPQEMPPSVFTDALNVRFINGRMQNMLNDQLTLQDHNSPSSYPVDLSIDPGRALIGYFQGADSVLYASNQSIYQFIAQEHRQLGTGYATSVNWVSFLFSNCVIFSNPNIIPQGMEPSSSVMSDLPDWDDEWKCKNMIGYKNFIVALNMTEHGTEYPQRIRWSDAAFPNTLPTSWDATDPTKLAGFNDLTDARGEIVTAKMLSDILYIFTTEEIFAMQYVGMPSIFSFRKINSDVGLLTKDSICNYKNVIVTMSRDNIYMFNGSSVQSIIDGKVRNKLFTDIDMAYKDRIKIFSNPLYNEVWIAYADKSSAGQLTKAAIYNVETTSWSFRSLPNIIDIANLRKPVDDTVKWDDANYSWDSAGQVPWNTRDFDGNVLIASTSDGLFYMLDHTTANPNNTPSRVERRYIDLDDAGALTTGVKAIKSFYPQFGGNGSFSIRVGTSDSIGGTITWQAPKRFTIGETNRVDFRVSGRYFSYEIVTSDNTKEWWITSMDIDFDYRFRGRRYR